MMAFDISLTLIRDMVTDFGFLKYGNRPEISLRLDVARRPGGCCLGAPYAGAAGCGD
jgi:hypothetical protein